MASTRVSVLTGFTEPLVISWYECATKDSDADCLRKIHSQYFAPNLVLEQLESWVAKRALKVQVGSAEFEQATFAVERNVRAGRA